MRTVGCDHWKPTCDHYQIQGRTGELLGRVEYNIREEFEGPEELINFGGFYDGPIIINEKTIRTDSRGQQHVIIRAVRFPKTPDPLYVEHEELHTDTGGYDE